MNVILTQDVDKLGKEGELVKVRPGFGRNFLLPKRLAVTASAAALKDFEEKKKKKKKKQVDLDDFLTGDNDESISDPDAEGTRD